MKILQLHADFIEYQPIKKEISNAEEAEKEQVRQDDILVFFTAVEEGDDPTTAKKAISDAKEFLQKLGLNKMMIYPFAHLSQNLARPSEALSILVRMFEEARTAGIEVFRAPFGWNKALQVKVKGHPLAEMSRSYGVGLPVPAPGKARRTELTENEMFARIKKSDFGSLPPTDHRVIGEQLDLFSFHEPSPGMVLWHEKGLTLRNILVDFIRREQKERGYIEISTPALSNTLLWRVSGHWEHYKDTMFLTEMGGEQFGLKPMNCPSTFLFYKTRRWSYRDLPLRVADFDPLFRNELSGVASGLFRVKILTQDDAHIFVTDEQIEEELGWVIDLVARFYDIFGLKYTPKISTMPDEHLGTKEQWDRAVEALANAVRAKGIKPVMKEKEGAFYGPKIDIDVTDSIGRDWQSATIQLDMQMPARFKLSYTGADGQEHTPVVIHRVIYGSLERFIGLILEHFKGKLPVWISPIQARVLPLSDDYSGYAQKVLERLTDAGVRAEGDFESGTISYKVRSAQVQKIPYIIVIGEREEKGKRIAVRTRDGRVKHGVKISELIKEVSQKKARFE